MSNVDFDSISPSAKSLLMTKALTTIPFAKEAVNMIWSNNKPPLNGEIKLSFKEILRCLHFETRYRSLDVAINEVGINNILEFSSGYSFRGLNLCKNPIINYIDTDLAPLLENKRIIVQKLIENYCNYSLDNLFMQALNILDADAFNKIIQVFPSGPVMFLNEGLLMYLNESQKQELCKNIYEILDFRGGYWTTADIYIKNDNASLSQFDIFNNRGKDFLAQHQVEENKFESFESAEAFFKTNGFHIYRKIEVPPSQVSSRKFLGEIPLQKLIELKNRQKTRETWILSIKPP